MNTLRQAVQEYLSLRRALGFKLQDAGKALLDFVTFMEQHRASYVTQALALAWAQQPIERSTRALGATPERCARLCASSQRHRSAHADSAPRLVAVPTQASPTVPILGR